MKNVEILFARPTYHPFPLFAWAIMLFQGEIPWFRKSSSHCVIRYEDNGVTFCTHITGAGVHWETNEKFLKSYEVTKVYKVDGEYPLVSVRQWINQRLNVEYDRKQITGFVIQFLGLTKDNMFGSDLKKYVCSEFCADFMSTFKGWELGDSDNWDLNKLEVGLVREKEARRTA